MICDTLQHLGRYRGLHPNLDTAIDYLLAHDLAALPLGRTEVDGDKVFINLMDATLHPDAGYHPEYHKLYADLQVDHETYPSATSEPQLNGARWRTIPTVHL